ncbi:MAG: hypothetical protein II821_03795 [Treponema sp.]|nr:hypothetical protein [Treponema sp.]
MMFRRFFPVVLLFCGLQAAFCFGKKDSGAGAENKDSQTGSQAPQPGSGEEKEEKSDEFIKIDLYLDTNGGNPKNHFNWKTKSTSYKDFFDAVSGASKVHSTKYFREAVFDTQGKSLKAPAGLRNLCLYSVSNPELLQKDDFKIEKSGVDGKKLIITFTHREISYKIESNENGEILVPESFLIKKPQNLKQNENPENTVPEKKSENGPSEEKPEVPAGDENSQNTEEKSPDDGFVSDEPAESLKMIYQGKLKAKLDENGVLTLSGKVNLEKRKEINTQELSLTAP